MFYSVKFYHNEVINIDGFNDDKIPLVINKILSKTYILRTTNEEEEIHKDNLTTLFKYKIINMLNTTLEIEEIKINNSIYIDSYRTLTEDENVYECEYLYIVPEVIGYNEGEEDEPSVTEYKFSLKKSKAYIAIEGQPCNHKIHTELYNLYLSLIHI